MSKQNIQPLAFSVQALCQAGGFSRAFIYCQWAAGQGPKRFKLGRKTMVLADDARAWLAALASNGAVVQ